MSDDQGSKKELKHSNPSKIVLLGAGATVLAIINMSAGTEARSPPVLILEYAALAGGLVALVGGLVMMAMANK